MPMPCGGCSKPKQMRFDLVLWRLLDEGLTLSSKGVCKKWVLKISRYEGSSNAAIQQHWDNGGDDTEICSMVGMRIYALRELLEELRGRRQ